MSSGTTIAKPPLGGTSPRLPDLRGLKPPPGIKILPPGIKCPRPLQQPQRP